MKSRKPREKFEKQYFKTAWGGKDLQKTEMSHDQAPNCDTRDVAIITYETKSI